MTQASPPVTPRATLFPSEPRKVTSALQIELSRQHLEPEISALEAYFLSVRLTLDPVLEARQPTKLAKPYPIGQCLEIAQAVERAVRDKRQPEFSGLVAQGRGAFERYMAGGGVFRRVWGDLRGKFFQNAFQLGTLYVDVSNDTVTPTKPKVEILPFDDAELNAIRDFRHYRQMVLQYWGGHVYPNHLLPELAPYCPLIHINAFGVATLREPTDYMIAMTRGDRFASAEAILAEPPMPSELFEHFAAAFVAQNRLPAPSPENGRTRGIEACRQYRSKRWYANNGQSTKIVAEVTKLKPILVAPQPTQRATQRSQEIRAALRATKQEIVELQARIAIAQTARAAYARALKENLPG